MQIFRKRGVVLSILLLAAMLLGGCSNLSADKGTLKIGVRDDIMNFGYLNKNIDKYYGLEIDIATEMAKRMGYQDIEFVTVEPDTRKNMLLKGKVDCIVATYSISDTRKENFDFSEPYYTDSTIIMVEGSSLFDGIDDLKGKTFGIVNGTNSGPLLANYLFEEGMITDKVVSDSDTETVYEGARVRKAEKYGDLSEMLEVGEIDAVCMDKCIAQTYMDEERKYLGFSLAQQEYGVASKKGSELSKEIDKAIKSMLEDGTIDEMINKWNPED